MRQNKAVLELTSQELATIKEAQLAFKEWKSVEAGDPRFAAVVLRWEAAKLTIALLLMCLVQKQETDLASMLPSMSLMEGPLLNRDSA